MVLVLNPYDQVKWQKAVHHKANFHTHTSQSDGSFTPHDVVDHYKHMGYTILALTDHDRVTWPWTGLSDLSNDYENRDPGQMEMLAIVGNELSRHHHTLSLFTDFKTEHRDLDQVLLEQAEYSGEAIAVFAHPAMHWARNLGEGAVLTDSVVNHYVRFFSSYSQLIGMEVHNGTRPLKEYPLDRALWDSLLEMLMPGRPVWGFATDDLHAEAQYGRDWLVIPLEEFTTEAARDALTEGRFYFSTVRLHEDSVPDVNQTPVIKSVNHDQNAGIIRINALSGSDPVDERAIVWISNGRVIHTGAAFSYREAEGLGNYVRAEITGEGGTTYTNPFGFKKNTNNRK